MHGLIENAEFYRSILDSLDEGVYFVDRERRILYWNAGAERVSGYSPHEAVGRCCHDNLLMHCDAAGHMLCLGECPLVQTMRDGKPRKGRIFLKHKHGYRVPVDVRIAPAFGADGEIVGATEVFSDMTSGVAAVEQARALKDEAFVDPLTRVCNRRSIEERLREALTHSAEVRTRTAVLFLDIDRFKSINDQWGHEAGDAVLRTVANTLTHSLRSYDFVGRWGGDEFVIILGNVDEERAREVCERCRALIERSQVTWQGRRVHVTCSAGWTMLRPGDDRESVIRRADAQMYECKRRSRGELSCNRFPILD